MTLDVTLNPTAFRALRVVDRAGRPQPGVDVRLSQLGEHLSMPRESPATFEPMVQFLSRTDADGRCEFLLGTSRARRSSSPARRSGSRAPLHLARNA